MLKLKLQYCGHLMQRADALEKTLMPGKIEGGKRRGQRGQDNWMAPPTQWTWVWASSRRWWRTGKPGVLQSMGSQRVRHDWATELTEFTLIHGPNIPDSYAILFFTASDFASITSHIHNWVLFLLWLSLFILSWAISPLISIDLGSSSFSVISFYLFILFMSFSRQKYWSGLPFPSPVNHVLS